MKYNLSIIMKRAHSAVRASKSAYADKLAANAREVKRGFITEEVARRNLPKVLSLSEALRMAWGEAKKETNTTDEDRLFILKMKDRWSRDDFQYAAELERRIREKAA